MAGNLIEKKPMPDAKPRAVAANTRCFIDTNVLVYADSPDAPEKQSQAVMLLRQLGDARSGVISTQVLNEYCNVALNKLKLPHDILRARLTFWKKQFQVSLVTPEIVMQAVDLHQTRSVSYYDALIVTSAQAANCAVLYSEDMNTGEIVGGVKLVNPFN